MIVLVGFMGAGKSTVGRLLAARLGVPFVDADAAIEAAEGRTIPAIFEADGEPGFRRIEAEVVRGLLDGPEAVLALGGGTLGSASVREALTGHRVVLLDVSLEHALSRVGDDASRPMLRNRDLPELYAARQQAYREAADIVVCVDGRAPQQVVARVLEALGEAGVGE